MRHYTECTCHLKPIKAVSFGDREMLLCFIQHFAGDEILSIAQLLGDRRGVIRITFRQKQSVKKLEELLMRKKLLIQNTYMGSCDMDGQFILVLLENVPSCVPEVEVEDAMSKYGLVSGSSREFYDFKGCRIENEKRKVLFTLLFTHVNLPARIRMGDAVVFIKVLGAGTLNNEGSTPSDREPGTSGHGHSHGKLVSRSSSREELDVGRSRSHMK